MLKNLIALNTLKEKRVISRVVIFATLFFLLAAIILSARPVRPSTSDSELAALKAELRNIEELRSDIVELQADVQELRRSSQRARLTETPVYPTTFSPDASALDDPFYGPTDAQVIVMAFSAYDCVPCRQFATETLPTLKKNYFDTGKVKFILRDFPVSAVDERSKIATLAHCAGEQGKYWAAHDMLWSKPQAVDSIDVVEFAGSIPGLSPQKLRKCWESGRYSEEIRADISDGKRIGARGMPGFFIGVKGSDGSFAGKFIRGAQPYAVFDRQLGEYLEQVQGKG